ncbi:hypothetical protein M378DRAFT_587140 [Amanita muscaria Koide BX008]|uniref:Uncharacterized protein n=1 Tax=Amanita muscaria (strain Koide BX008) TaxID=946122 RepID=A0A0C2TCA7_AMAMK|nr:hypothetical protein M378DRAFT_587140 [Amanita muscaria Koide BX008]
MASIPIEEGFAAEVINHESSEQIIEDATSTVGSHVSSTEEADQVSEPAPADLTEVSEDVTGGLEVGEEDANGNLDQEANQEVEAKLTIDDALARPWTPSYSAHSQGTPLVATKELEDVALSAERSVGNHAENAVTVDSEHDNTVDEQINTTENEVYGQLSTEVSHANPVIALEGHKIEDETLNPQQSSQAETNPNLENEIPPRPWTPSYAIHSQVYPRINCNNLIFR